MKLLRIDYYSTWAHRYDEQVAGLSEDLDFYLSLAREADELVVEVGVGTGRIAMPLATAGHRVLGIDLHREMLLIAAHKARGGDLRNRLAFVQADMRRFALREPATLVLLTALTFMYNLTTVDQLATLRCCHDALRPGGRLAVHVFNPDPTLIARWLGRDTEEWERLLGRPWTAHHADYWPTQQLTRGTYRLDRPDGNADYATHTLRWVYRYEMEHLFARTGFEVETVYGDFDRSPLGDGSPAQVWVARRSR